LLTRHHLSQRDRSSLITNFCRVDVLRLACMPSPPEVSPHHPPLLHENLFPKVEEVMLRQAKQWSFSAFKMDRIARGRSLSILCTHIFHTEGLISHFHMDPVDVYSFFHLVERGYQSTNPYHNALHAADVAQATSVFCSQPRLRAHLTPLELLATFVAAVCHDLDHPGVNQKFLVSTGSHLAVLYDHVSVLENHHWRAAISCFVESGLSSCLSESQFSEFKDLVRALILATDISRQQEFLTHFQHFLDTGEINMAHFQYRHFVLQIAMKCADISNPCRPWQVSRLWSLRACEEFFRQGDRERELKLQHITPLCDRLNVTVAKVQVGFYSFIAEPLFKEWHRYLDSRLSAEMLEHLYRNKAAWEQEVVSEESVTAVSSSDIQSDSGDKKVYGEVKMSLGETQELTSLQRRLSLPVSDPLHRMFDVMTQPNCNPYRTTSHLRRNFSLNDRRRPYLLQGFHGRNSLKPSRGRKSRPTSSGFENSDPFRTGQTLQSCENIMSSDQSTVDIKSENLEQSEEFDKENKNVLMLVDKLSQRRGSAPSNLVLSDLRVAPQGISQRHQSSLTATHRRGSLPSELLTESLPKHLRCRLLCTSQVPLEGGLNNRPSLLRRRSMGTELLSLAGHSSKDISIVQKYLGRPF